MRVFFATFGICDLILNKAKIVFKLSEAPLFKKSLGVPLN